MVFLGKNINFVDCNINRNKYKFMEKDFLPEWAYGMDCAVTVVDCECRIIYMNER